MKHLSLVLLLCGATVAEAGKAKPAPLVEINKALAEGEFELALKKADQALRKNPSPGDQAQLHLLRGQAYFALGKQDKARAAFVSALQRDPLATLDAARANPDAVRLFEKAQADIPSTLSVAVTGGEANLLIDDRDMGPAPLKTPVGGGGHVIEARAADGRSVRKEVVVPPGLKLDVSLELPKLEAPTEATTAVAPPPPPPVDDKPAATTVKKTTTKGGPSKVAALGLLIGGGLVGVGGGVFIAMAAGQYDRLVNESLPDLTPQEEASAVSNGTTFQTVGWIGIGVGAAALAAGAVMLGLSPSSPQPDDTDARLGVLVTPQGDVWVGVTGRLP